MEAGARALALIAREVRANKLLGLAEGDQRGENDDGVGQDEDDQDQADAEGEERNDQHDKEPEEAHQEGDDDVANGQGLRDRGAILLDVDVPASQRESASANVR